MKVHYLLGTVLMATNRPSQAMESLRHCTNLNPSHPDALNVLGTLLSSTGHLEEAIQTLIKATRNAPQNATVWFNLGRAYVDNKQFQQGAEAFRKAVELQSDYSKALNGLGLCLGESGNLEDAITQLARCIEQDPTLQVAHINLIRYFIESEQYDHALERSKAAIERWPDVARFYVFKAAALENAKEDQKAFEALEKALELEPENTFALNQMSNHLYAQGQWKEAESYCRRSLELEPESAKALNNLGRIRLIRGDLDGA